MTHCPTCNARYKGETICNRCKTDLSSLLKIEKAAAWFLEKAKYALTESNYERALRFARQSLFLHRTEAAESLEAFILAATGDFQPICKKLNRLD